MNYFLGIDGGASKTEGVIIDEQEKLVVHIIGGPVNYHQGGEEQTAQNLEKVIKDALSQANFKMGDIAFAVLGVAGRDTKEDEIILDKLAQNLLDGSFKNKVKVVSDVEIAFASSVSHDYGIVLISGTGANCFAKGKNGKVAWAGNWGWFLGDQGSGFALGLGALQAVMRDFDSRGEKTILSELILNNLHLDRADQLGHWVYRKEIPVKEIAGLAPLVFEAHKKQDKVAQDLVNKLVAEMTLSIKTVVAKTSLVSEEFEIGLVGGIFKEELVIKLLEQKIKQVAPKARIVLPKMEPAMAAAILAKKEAL